MSEVRYLTDPLQIFEETYKSIRSKEGRWVSDEKVKLLPSIQGNHVLKSEWEKRAWMLYKFLKYLRKKQPKAILDIGCGNGWMTHKVGQVSQKITGIDVGKEELEQAARCFGSDSIQFICCSDWSLLPKASFDVIYFAGSFHYFEPDDQLWETLKSLLKPNGEIHILETRFYTSDEAIAAKKRTEDYFDSLGEKADYYYHLAWSLLPENHEILYKPSILQKIFPKQSPFPWIRIRK